MNRMLFDKSSLSENDKNQAVAAYSVPFIFRVVPISGDDNQCLQFALSAFYKDGNESSKANVLWNLVNWSNNPVMRCNDNAVFFNRMLGYNTAFFDNDTKDWYWDEVNPNTATYYIQFSNEYFDYIQPVRPNDDIILSIKDHEIIVKRTHFRHPDQVLECIVKHIIPLYIHVMAKNKSCVKMLPSIKNKHEDEFNIKTNELVKLPVIQNGKGVIQNHVDFSKDGNYKVLYDHKFRTYKYNKHEKYAHLIKHLYQNLDPKNCIN